MDRFLFCLNLIDESTKLGLFCSFTEIWQNANLWQLNNSQRINQKCIYLSLRYEDLLKFIIKPHESSLIDKFFHSAKYLHESSSLTILTNSVMYQVFLTQIKFVRLKMKIKFYAKVPIVSWVYIINQKFESYSRLSLAWSKSLWKQY